MLQADGGEQAGHPRAHHQHVEVAPRLRWHAVEGHAVGVFVEDLQFRHQELAVAGVEFGADDEVHHLLHQRGRRLRKLPEASVPVRLQRVQGAFAHGGLVLGRNAALGIAEQLAGRADVPADQRRVAAQVNQRVDEGGNVGVRERGFEGVVRPAVACVCRGGRAHWQKSSVALFRADASGKRRPGRLEPAPKMHRQRCGKRSAQSDWRADDLVHNCTILIFLKKTLAPILAPA